MYGLKNVRSRRADALTRVGWDRLEVLLADHYRGQGWDVEHVGTGGTRSRFDGGIDLKLRRADEYVVVQCKHWNAKQVPHNEVHQLLGIMVNEGATGAILATSGEFTRYARESAAKGGHVELIDGDALRTMLGPLPELDVVPGVAPAAAAIAAQVGERLLLAAEDRIRNGHGFGGHGRRAAHLTFTGLLLKIGLFLVFAWFIVVVIGGGLERTISTIAVPRPPVASAIVSPPGVQPDSAAAIPSTASTAATNPCHEIIDARSGMYIDHCAPVSPTVPPTAAEIRESQRRADEAAAILAPHTLEF